MVGKNAEALSNDDDKLSGSGMSQHTQAAPFLQALYSEPNNHRTLKPWPLLAASPSEHILRPSLHPVRESLLLLLPNLWKPTELPSKKNQHPQTPYTPQGLRELSATALSPTCRMDPRIHSISSRGAGAVQNKLSWQLACPQ